MGARKSLRLRPGPSPARGGGYLSWVNCRDSDIVIVRSRCVVCSGRAGGSPVTHRSSRSREDRQEHVQVVLATNWCLRMGRVRFGSAGVAHHGFPDVCVEAFNKRNFIPVPVN